MTSEDDEGGSQLPWDYIAENVQPELISAIERVKTEKIENEIEDVRPTLVVRFGKSFSTTLWVLSLVRIRKEKPARLMAIAMFNTSLYLIQSRRIFSSRTTKCQRESRLLGQRETINKMMHGSKSSPLGEQDDEDETREEKGKQPSDIELMKEKFAELLLGEDMSGGGKGVSSALAL